MSEEFERVPENTFSAFWPLLILVTGLFIWAGYQVYATNEQRIVYAKQFQAAIPAINKAQDISTQYVALMKDLVETSAKDQAAAQIVKDAIQAGLIHVQQNPNSAAAPAAPAK